MWYKDYDLPIKPVQHNALLKVGSIFLIYHIDIRVISSRNKAIISDNEH